MLGAAVTHRRCSYCKQQRGATGSLEGVEMRAERRVKSWRHKWRKKAAPASHSRRRSTSRHAQPWRRLRHRSASRRASPRDELPTPRRGTSSRRCPASRRAPSRHELLAPPGLPRRRGTSSDRRLASRSAAARAPFAPSRRAKVAGQIEVPEEPCKATNLWLLLHKMAPESGNPAAPSVELLRFHPFGKAPAGAGSGAALGALPNRALVRSSKRVKAHHLQV